MSLVIAEIKDGVVYMGADTQVSSGETKRNLTTEPNLKITRMPHGILLGKVGAVRVSNILINFKEWFEPLEHQPLTKEFLVTKIMPKFYNELKKRELLSREHIAGFEGSFLIAQKDKLFLINGNFTVNEVPRFDAIGAGNDAAYTTYQLLPNASVREKMLTSLRLASEYDTSISAPYAFCDTKSLEIELVEE